MQHVIDATLKPLPFPVFLWNNHPVAETAKMWNASRCQYGQLSLMDNMSKQKRAINVHNFAVPTFTVNQIFVTQSDNFHSRVWPLWLCGCFSSSLDPLSIRRDKGLWSKHFPLLDLDCAAVQLNKQQNWSQTICTWPPHDFPFFFPSS